MSFIINPFLFGGGGSPPLSAIVLMAAAEYEASTLEVWSLGGNPAINSSITGAHGRYYDNVSSNQTIALPASYQGITIRCRFQVRQSQSGTRNILKLQDSTGSQIGVHWSNPGNFAVVRGTSTHLDTSAGNEITLNTWQWVELATFIDNSVGSFEGRLYDDSGVTLASLSGSGVDTQETANAFAERLLGGETNVDTVLDNVSVSSGLELLGRCRVEVLYPSGVGDLAQWTRGGVDSGANWSQVNDTIKNGADWIQSSAADQFDFYAMQNRSIAGTPLAVQVNALGRSVSGTTTFRMALRIGGVTYEDAATQTYTSTVADRNAYAVWNLNPATNAPWADSDIDSLQAGYRSLSSNVAIADMNISVLVQL